MTPNAFLFVKDLEIKLTMAMDVCKHQENLKKEFYDQRVSQNSDQFN